MAEEEPCYEILAGVRRAKAYSLAGRATIPAVVQDPDGKQSPVMDLPLARLRSPHKERIDVSTPRFFHRFQSILKAVQEGRTALFDPIVVELGSRGPLIADVSWITDPEDV